MPLMVNPNTGKLVDVAPAFVDQLSRAGFKEQEPAPEAPRASARKGRPRKTAE